MAAVLNNSRPQQPRSEQNTSAAFLLALMMHALLGAALWVSVQWHTEPAGDVVVELWGSSPPAAPVVVAPPPPPAPVKVEPQPERPDADIVVKQEKKAPPKVESPPPDTEKIEAEKRRVEAERKQKEAEAKRREAEAKRLAEEKKQLEAERRKQAEAMAQAAERRREEERRAEVRKAEEARVLAQAGSGSAGGSPVASTGAGGRGDASYASLLASLIKPRIVFAVPDHTAPSVYADFDVDLLPTGEILAVRLVKPSGLPGYDAAVERAIRRTDPFPKKADGTVDRTVTLRFRPVEK